MNKGKKTYMEDAKDYGLAFLGRETDKRRKPQEERTTWEITQLWQRSHEIINLAVRGFKQVDIAEILNITPQTVSNTLNSELAIRKIAELRECRDEETKIVNEKIRVLTNKALQVYHEIFDDESGELGLKDKGEFAKHFMSEMSGLKAPTRIQAQHVSYQLTDEDRAEFKARGLAAMKDAGMPIIDAEVVDES